MVSEAQTHSQADEERKQEVEARNKLDGLVYSTEKLVKDNKDKLPESEVTQINSAVAEAKSALESGNRQRMEQGYDRLTQASHKVAEVLYRTTGAQDAAGGPAAAHAGAPPTGEADDGVIDAEYVDTEGEEGSK